MGKQRPITSPTMGAPSSASGMGACTTVLLVTAAPASGDALAAACRRRGSTVDVCDPDGRSSGDTDVVLLDLTTDTPTVLHLAREVLEGRQARVVAIGGGDEAGAVPAEVTVEAWVSPDTPLEQLGEIIQGAATTSGMAPSAPSRQRGRTADLTPREREVLIELLVGGDANETADRLGISAHTVRTHVQNILDKLGVRTRAEAAAWALREGLVPAGSSGGQAS